MMFFKDRAVLYIVFTYILMDATEHLIQVIEHNPDLISTYGIVLTALIGLTIVLHKFAPTTLDEATYRTIVHRMMRERKA